MKSIPRRSPGHSCSTNLGHSRSCEVSLSKIHNNLSVLMFRLKINCFRYWFKNVIVFSCDWVLLTVFGALGHLLWDSGTFWILSGKTKNIYLRMLDSIIGSYVHAFALLRWNAVQTNDNDNDHLFRPLPVHKALICEENWLNAKIIKTKCSTHSGWKSHEKYCLLLFWTSVLALVAWCCGISTVNVLREDDWRIVVVLLVDVVFCVVFVLGREP